MTPRFTPIRSRPIVTDPSERRRGRQTVARQFIKRYGAPYGLALHSAYPMTNERKLYVMSIPTLPGINARTVTAPRLTTRVLCAGDESGTSVIFIHGNLTSATFWEETMLAMPAGYHSIAHDQRGFGEADPAAAVDGSRGLADMSDDVIALLDTAGHRESACRRPFHGRWRIVESAR